ncbi:MAG: TPM domain-containing protein, partial [bacterium]
MPIPKALSACMTLGLAFGLALPVRAAGWPKGVPKSPTAPITDLAGLFSQGETQSLDLALRQQWQAGRFQLAVLSLPSLGGQPLEDLSIQIARAWGLGGKAESNGVLLLIAAKEHRIRIEVGSRLEGDLPDIICRRIIADIMAPKMRRGDDDGALQA